jgi:hypothetical protein
MQDWNEKMLEKEYSKPRHLYKEYPRKTKKVIPSRNFAAIEINRKPLKW